jgi:FtsH-binding integral membrane protein
MYTNSYFDETALQSTVNSTMKRVFGKMTLGLIVTALVSMFCASSYGFLSFMFTNTWAMWGLVIAEVAIVLGLSAGVNKLSSPVASLLFYVFAIINGMAFAPIFLIYTGASIAKTFFITAAVFGAMTVYGYTTSKDLTKFGTFLMMALFGLIIVSVVNIFAQSSSLEWIISFVGVLIFIGLTAWDVQQIKQMALQMPGADVSKLATLGALSLYLDFINLFLYLLRFFGNNRD